jgi:uncharacterized membrane protein
MYVLRILILVIHISAAAVLFGAGLGLPRLLRKSFELGAPMFKLATEEVKKRAGWTGIASLATLWTGIALIFILGGFKAAPINYHISLTLMFGAILVNLLVARPAVKRLVFEGAKPEPSRDVVQASVKRLSMGQGIMHLIWVIILVLMFHRIYPSP